MDDFTQNILPIIIIAIVAVGVIVYAVLLNKKVNRVKKKEAASELKNQRTSIKVSRVSGFIPHQFRTFFDALRAAMPSNYIILPNIAVELLFRRQNRKDLKLEGQYVSFGVFTTAFAPVLLIELDDYSTATEAVFDLSDSIKELIRNIGVPIMEYDIRDHYDIDDLRRAIAKAMNPLFAGK
jgi:hypothetical protein